MSKNTKRKYVETPLIDRNSFSYYIFENNESFGSEFLYKDLIIPYNQNIGTTLVKILNMKSSLLKLFDEFLSILKTLETLNDIHNYINDFFIKHENIDFLCMIKNRIYNEYIEYAQILNGVISVSPSLSEEDMIEELYSIISTYFFNITSTLENLCSYITNDENNIKQYLLWHLEIPKSHILFAKVNYKKNIIELLSNNNHECFLKNNKLYKLIPVRKYTISDFTELLNILIDQYFQKKFVIKICHNCGKYFIPSSRTDEKYCDNPSPQNSSKTCKEYGAKKTYRDKLNSDEARRAHYNTSQFFRMKINRAKEEQEIKLYTKLFNTYKTNYEKQKKKFNNNKISESDFINWIVAQKGIN